MFTITMEFWIPRTLIKEPDQIAQWVAMLVPPVIAYNFAQYPLLFVSSVVVVDGFDPTLLKRTVVLQTTPAFLAIWGTTAPEVKNAVLGLKFSEMYEQVMQTSIVTRVTIVLDGPVDSSRWSH